MFNPAGLSVKIKYSDGSYGDEVAYGTANADQFTFNPTLDTALKTSDEKVTVTYAEKTADIKIKVNKKTPVVPENPTVEKVEIKQIRLRQSIKKAINSIRQDLCLQ